MLRTERLLLREFRRDDWERMHAYQNDARYLRYYDRERMDPGESQTLVAAFLSWRADRPRIKTQLAIELAATGEMIGNVGVRRDDPAGRDAEIGYELNPDHWGQGFATEAALAMRDWGFGEQGLTRLHAHCIADNAASSNVLEKLGMRREGLLRNHVFQKGRFWDVMLYGLLREEWAEMIAYSQDL